MAAARKAKKGAVAPKGLLLPYADSLPGDFMHSKPSRDSEIEEDGHDGDDEGDGEGGREGDLEGAGDDDEDIDVLN